VLAIVAYLPVFSQPFIADDFVNILKADQYVPRSGWSSLLADPIHLYRPVFLLPTYWLHRTFGAWPPAFYALSVLLHVLVTWLVFALGAWKPVGWRVAAVAAAFFAVYEGHQEAVMWYSASYELYQVGFLLVALIFWIAWLQAPRMRWGRYIAALASFPLALASKESAVVLPALLLLPPLVDRSLLRRALAGILPFVLVGLAYGWLLFGAAAHYPRLDDGSFSLHAPVVITWLHSYCRLLWVWGVFALAMLALLRGWNRLVLIGGLWMALTLLPYSFLTYMNRVPSRHTYLASMGLAWVVAAGFLALSSRRRWVLVLVAAVVLGQNVVYLWTWKRPQYLERARATEALIALARRTTGPVYVHRFPYLPIVAQEAVFLATGRPRSSVVLAISGEPARGLLGYSYSMDGVNPVVQGVP
jgi:hypothetical protein